MNWQSGDTVVRDPVRQDNDKVSYWGVLSPLSVYFDRESLYIFVYCFCSGYLAQPGLQHSGLPVPK